MLSNRAEHSREVLELLEEISGGLVMDLNLQLRTVRLSLLTPTSNKQQIWDLHPKHWIPNRCPHHDCFCFLVDFLKEKHRCVALKALQKLGGGSGIQARLHPGQLPSSTKPSLQAEP